MKLLSSEGLTEAGRPTSKEMPSPCSQSRFLSSVQKESKDDALGTDSRKQKSHLRGSAGVLTSKLSRNLDAQGIVSGAGLN